jgi:thioredoxin 1
MQKILRFTADWCGPCKSLAAGLEDLKFTLKDNMPPIEVIDIDEHLEMTIKYGIRGVPTLIMLDGDQELRRLHGTVPKHKLMDWIRGYDE